PSSTVRLLRNPTALTACSRRLSAILTALPFTPSNQKLSRLFHAQREKYGHSVVSLRHRSGNAIYPLKRGLFPRHLRAEKACFFVHARILDGSSRHAGRKGKKSFKKIVQICALLCSIITGCISLQMCYIWSHKDSEEDVLILVGVAARYSLIIVCVW
ncbi:hypothetical protein U9687_24490, partial [Escherichia coli]